MHWKKYDFKVNVIYGSVFTNDSVCRNGSIFKFLASICSLDNVEYNTSFLRSYFSITSHNKVVTYWLYNIAAYKINYTVLKS